MTQWRMFLRLWRFDYQVENDCRRINYGGWSLFWSTPLFAVHIKHQGYDFSMYSILDKIEVRLLGRRNLRIPKGEYVWVKCVLDWRANIKPLDITS